MKRRCLCIIALTLYILTACTMLSLKIEKEMLTQVEVLEVKDKGVSGMPASVPQTAFFRDANGRHLFELIEGSGWESGLRVQEIPRDVISTSEDGSKALLPGGSDYCFITTASRQPVVGELVEIVEAGTMQPALDQLLIVYPEGIPEGLEIPADMNVLDQSGNSILVQVESTDPAFFEHKQMGKYPSMAGKNWRIFSMNTAESFWSQLPLVAVIAGILLCFVLLWFFFCCVCTRAERFGRAFLPAIAASLVSFAALQILLSRIDLPSAMLPDVNILHMSHYADELSLMLLGLNSFPQHSGSFHMLCSQVATTALLVLGGSLSLTAALIAISVHRYKRK